MGFAGNDPLAALGQLHDGRFGFGREFFEIEVVQSLGAATGLVGGNLDVGDVLGGLIEMSVKVFDPGAEAVDIGKEQAQFAPDRARLFAHAGVFEDGAHGVEGGHAGRG